MTIRANTAASVVRYLKAGASVGNACGDALHDLRELRGGYIGPVVIHAIDRQGDHHVVSTCAEEETPMYWLWTSELGQIERRKPVVVRL
jgi:L-asparaginase